MANEKLISFEVGADFGFFKKPDYNDGLLLSYNILHKPALLGILGAIAGLDGYKQNGKLPEYYLKLKDLLTGVKPIGDEKGNFQKTAVKYTNTVGYANLDGNLLIEETMLIKPAYECFLLLNTDDKIQGKLYDYIKNSKAEYIPYLGKNEYQAWLGNNVTEYTYESFTATNDFTIDSLFVKAGTIRNQKVEPTFCFTLGSMTNSGSYCYFENLPVGFDEQLMQYKFNQFAYTNWTLQANSKIENLYRLTNSSTVKIIQLF